ncbi:hypothetical protein [Aerosakkonema funiforme]|nr:hypothetical protein [Aerosakkonema funiforme]
MFIVAANIAENVNLSRSQTIGCPYLPDFRPARSIHLCQKP